MATAIGLKNFYQHDWTAGKYEYVDKWPLMYHPAPMLILLGCYLMFVLKIGPDMMKTRPAFKLTWSLAVYNALQVIASIYLTYRCGHHLWKYGLVNSTCIMDNPESARAVNTNTWLYGMAKISELLDTVFFVLRKKQSQVSFLHVYHHSFMSIGTWLFLKYEPIDYAFIGLLNSGVHIVMYTYYGLAAFGPKFEKYLAFKKYITKMQLLQFLSMMIFLYNIEAISGCRLPAWLLTFSRGMVFSFILLFSNFYLQSYSSKKLKKTVADMNTTYLS